MASIVTVKVNVGVKTTVKNQIYNIYCHCSIFKPLQQDEYYSTTGCTIRTDILVCNRMRPAIETKHFVGKVHQPPTFNIR